MVFQVGFFPSNCVQTFGAEMKEVPEVVDESYRSVGVGPDTIDSVSSWSAGDHRAGAAVDGTSKPGEKSK